MPSDWLRPVRLDSLRNLSRLLDDRFLSGIYGHRDPFNTSRFGAERGSNRDGDTSYGQIVDGDGSKAPQRLVRDHGKASVETDRGSAESDTLPEQGALTENSWIKGIVKWFNNDKGYGFISTDSNIDVFVHWRDISSWDRSLAQGDEVEFMITRTAKGYQAINVMKAGSEEGGAGQEEVGRVVTSDAQAVIEQTPGAEPSTDVAVPPSAEDESANTESSDSEEGVF